MNAMCKGIIVLALTLLVGCADDSAKQCVRGGCSGELCVEKNGPPLASNCMWSDSYRCYKMAGTCERQPSGKCGWTPTDELSQCLTNANRVPPFLNPRQQ